MFGKLNRQTIHHHFNKAKNFLGNAYHQTKGFLNDVHHGVNTFKSTDQEVKPYKEKYAGKHTHNKLEYNVNRALTGYDNIRSKVVEVDNVLIRRQGLMIRNYYLIQ